MVPPGSADALRAALAELIDRPERHRAMGEAARARAGLFSAERQALEFCDLYHRMLPAPRVATRSRAAPAPGV